MQIDAEIAQFAKQIGRLVFPSRGSSMDPEDKNGRLRDRSRRERVTP